MTLPDGKLSIFCDSSNGLKLGILDSSFNWIEYQELNIARSSTLLFKELHRMLEENKVELTDLERIYLMMGPGSYTGIRLLQGMKDLYSTWGLDVYGFYSFEIPKLSRINKGQFLMSAYKGEYYSYEWNSEDESQTLLNEVPQNLENGSIFSILDKVSHLETKSVYELLKSDSRKIFSQVNDKKLKRNAFYFRPLEKEFNVSFPELG